MDIQLHVLVQNIYLHSI